MPLREKQALSPALVAMLDSISKRLDAIDTQLNDVSQLLTQLIRRFDKKEEKHD